MAVSPITERFPEDFVFQPSPAEFTNLKSQFATSSWGGTRKLPLAFTEHGAIMAAMVLNSPCATEVSVYVVRAFVQLRDTLLTQPAVRIARKPLLLLAFRPIAQQSQSTGGQAYYAAQAQVCPLSAARPRHALVCTHGIVLIRKRP